MRRYALFVGVNSYDDKAIRPLRYSIPDASVLADRFGRLGFKTSLLPDPTHQQLLAAVEDATAGLGRGDVFLFFFAGHGFTAQDGAHLLFCRDDRKRMLCVNSAGIRVDALELLTGEGGFHRAFLLDSCRSDAFADEDARGSETRDLDLVAMPETTDGDGTFFLLRSCDRFQPSLEIAGFGHGLFTQGLLEAMDAGEPALALCGDAFAGAVREHMDVLARRESIAARQRPSSEINGPAFPLFGEGVFAPSTTVSKSKPLFAAVSAPALVVCPVCGRKNEQKDTFRCRECGRDNLCLRHQDAESFLCYECEAEWKQKAEAAERARKAHERAEAERKAAEAAMPKAGDTKTIVLPGGAKMEMVWCPPGEFMMGSPESEMGRKDNETQHRVTLTKGFWMAKTPVTQAQWGSVMGNNPAKFKGQDRPVECVSWGDCIEFCRKAGQGLQLPTEAQWEYACRAGTTGAYGGTGRLADMGWYYVNSGLKTHPVGQKQPNAWGLYDMHGNVWEWCADCYGDYPNGPVTAPQGASFGSYRLLRGGGWDGDAGGCRSAYRYHFNPSLAYDYLGFRPARILP